jgi:hypothetical protein
MTHLELEQYVKSLAARIAELEKKPEPLKAGVPQVVESRRMCPHCGEKPNHFFHVKNCAKNKKKNNGEKETPS